MKLSDVPKKMPVPFGVNGSRLDIDTTPTTGDNNASYSLGFPDVTMLNESAGGKPPKGQNFNQIFYELALDVRWNQSGGLYKYDSTFSSAVGGYPQGSLVLGSDGLTIYQSTTDDNLTDPDSTSSSGWDNLSNKYLKVSNNLSDISGSANKSSARTNLNLDRFQQYTDQTTMVSPLSSAYIYVNSLSWGMYNTSSGANVPLPITSGGTGAINASSARSNIGAAALNGSTSNDFQVSGGTGNYSAVSYGQLSYGLSLKANTAGSSSVDFQTSGGTGKNSAVAYNQFTSGDGANGHWVKCPQYQLCRQNLSLPASSSTTWTFPNSFPSAPGVYMTVFNSSSNVWLTGVNANSCTIYNNSDSPVNINIMAIY